MSDLDDFWDAAPRPNSDAAPRPNSTAVDPKSALGPIFTATYESDSTCCGDLILPGEDIRADGSGGWIHASDDCEAIVTRQTARPTSCPHCFCIHPGECA